jgi:hypothetical protein
MGSVYASRTDLEAGDARPEPSPRAGERKRGPDPLAPPLPSARSTLRIQCAFVLLLAAASVTLAIGVVLWLQRTEYFWRNPITDARFQAMTNSDGLDQAAAVSRDGHFVASLSDRDGPMDVLAKG